MSKMNQMIVYFSKPRKLYALHDKHVIEWNLVFMKLLRMIGKSSFIESYHISSRSWWKEIKGSETESHNKYFFWKSIIIKEKHRDYLALLYRIKTIWHIAELEHPIPLFHRQFRTNLIWINFSTNTYEKDIKGFSWGKIHQYSLIS